MIKPTFEESIDLICKELDKRRMKWNYCIPMVSFEDIRNIILNHIHNKWHLYDPKQPLANWVNRVASNQIINQSRNYYTIHLPPCYNCACNIGENVCSLYGTYNSQCKLYAKWEKEKKPSLQINLPSSEENHKHELKEIPNEHIDYVKTLENIKTQAKVILTENEYEIFCLLFLDKWTESDLIKKYNYKQSKETKHAYNKQLETIKNNIYKKIKNSLYSDDIDICFQ
jgi:hypothetical protein